MLCVCVCLVMSDSLRPSGLQPTRFLCPWGSPCKNIGVGCHALLQGIFPSQESNPGLLHSRQILTLLNLFISSGSFHVQSLGFSIYSIISSAYNDVLPLLFQFEFHFWLPWVFVAAQAVSQVAVSEGYSLLQCTGSRHTSVIVAHGLSSCGSQTLEHRLSSCGAQTQQLWQDGLSRSMSRGIFPNQGSNPHSLHWQANS